MTATLEPAALTAADVTAAAYQWHRAGFSVLPVRDDGSKRPDLAGWTRFQHEQPSDRQIEAWFGDQRRTGLGVVCGAVSGGLEMFELEGRCVADGAKEKLLPALRAAGVLSVWRRLVNGYADLSPTGGLHLMYRLSDWEVPGNTKVAERPAREDELDDREREILRKNPHKVFRRVLAETRGEGGFVVAAPSHGSTHDSGRPWMFTKKAQPGQVPTITWDERGALFAAIHAVLDEMPEPEPVQPRTPRPRGEVGERPGDVWAAQTDWADVLNPHGWRHVYRRGDMDFWRRPGKNIGWSARTGGRHDGLFVWSTSTEFPTEVHISKFRAYSVLNHDGDDSAAASELRRLGYGGEQSTDRRPVSPAGPRAAAQENSPASNAEPVPALAVTSNPVAEFWTRRPALSHIHDFARARRVAPWATLGAVLARVVAATDPNVQLPPTIGSYASLNLFVGLVGRPGGGKDAARKVAFEALELGREYEVQPFPLGSGEGLSHMFMRESKEGPEQYNTRALVVVGEIDTLTALAKRQSSTVTSQLRQAAMGEQLGFFYVDTAKRMLVPEHRYRLCLIAGIQPKRAGGLLAEADGGTPQRFVWLPADDPDAPDDAPPCPEPLLWVPPAWHESGVGRHAGGMYRVPIRIPADAEKTIVAAHLARIRGQGEALDGHALLTRLKVAVALAILEGKYDVDDEDWQLSEVVMAVSDRTRAECERVLAEDSRAQNQQQALAEAARTIVIEEHVAAAAIGRVSGVIKRVLARSDGGWRTGAELRRAVAGRDRPHVDASLSALVLAGEVEEDKVRYKNQTGTRYRLAERSR